MRDDEDTDVELPCDVLEAMDVYMVQHNTGVPVRSVRYIPYPFVNDATRRRATHDLLNFM